MRRVEEDKTEQNFKKCKSCSRSENGNRRDNETKAEGIQEMGNLEFEQEPQRRAMNEKFPKVGMPLTAVPQVE